MLLFVRIGSSYITSHDAGVVPVIRIQVRSQFFPAITAVTRFPHEEFTGIIPIELFTILNPRPRERVDTTGSCTV
jgi:hypothetical protein